VRSAVFLELEINKVAVRTLFFANLTDGNDVRLSCCETLYISMTSANSTEPPAVRIGQPFALAIASSRLDASTRALEGAVVRRPVGCH
jgi:hypothetical protein